MRAWLAHFLLLFIFVTSLSNGRFVAARHKPTWRRIIWRQASSQGATDATHVPLVLQYLKPRKDVSSGWLESGSRARSRSNAASQ
jgi:hypothetical protein